MQMLYHQLPYHRERIKAHTAWSFELQQPLSLPAMPDPPQPAASATAGNQASAANLETWSVHGLLTDELSSARAKSGDPVQALVVEPVYDRDKTNSSSCRRAPPFLERLPRRATRALGRNGKLRCTFQQVEFPGDTSGLWRVHWPAQRLKRHRIFRSTQRHDHPQESVECHRADLADHAGRARSRF
jgi:hypothetical protein